MSDQLSHSLIVDSAMESLGTAENPRQLQSENNEDSKVSEEILSCRVVPIDDGDRATALPVPAVALSITESSAILLANQLLEPQRVLLAFAKETTSYKRLVAQVIQCAPIDVFFKINVEWHSPADGLGMN